MTRFGKDGRGQILYEDETATLGAAIGAGACSAAIGDYQNGLDEDFRILKVEGAMAVTGLAAGEMAVLCLADGALTAAEIAEALTASPDGPNDVPAIEYSHRPVFPVATLWGNDQSTNLINFEKSVRWTFSDDEAWQWVLFNPGNAHAGALTYVMWAKHYGVWVK